MNYNIFGLYGFSRVALYRFLIIESMRIFSIELCNL